MIPPFTSLKFIDYVVVDNGINLHFLASGALPGTVTDYYINLTDIEISSARNSDQLKATIQRKIDRLYNGVGISVIVDAIQNTVFTPVSSIIIPSYSKESSLGAQSLITPLSINSLGVELGAMSLASPSSVAWGIDNIAYGIPFVISKPLSVQKLFWYNGAILSGNVDCGIYSDSGNLLVSAGSTLQAGINQLQEAIVSPILLGCGQYYMVLISSSSLATFFAISPGVQGCKALGCFQALTTIPLPLIINEAAYSASFIPIFGLSSENLVV